MVRTLVPLRGGLSLTKKSPREKYALILYSLLAVFRASQDGARSFLRRCERTVKINVADERLDPFSVFSSFLLASLTNSYLKLKKLINDL